MPSMLRNNLPTVYERDKDRDTPTPSGHENDKKLSSVQATERSCDSKMEGLCPDKFAFALATNTPAGCLSDRTFLRKQNGGVSLRQVRVCETK